MNISSDFIHEELFIIEGGESSELETVSYELGVIATIGILDDEQLLQSILKATKLESKDILRSDLISDAAKTWLVFSESFDHNGTMEIPTKKISQNEIKIILAYPLSRLRGSQNEKAELWGILKEHFNL